MEDPGQDALYLRPGADDGLDAQAMDTYDVEAVDFVYLPGDIVRRWVIVAKRNVVVVVVNGGGDDGDGGHGGHGLYLDQERHDSK
jgi:hypothetical protein